MPQPAGRGCTTKPKPWEWLGRPILADGPREMLNQFFTTSLRSLHVAC